MVKAGRASRAGGEVTFNRESVENQREVGNALPKARSSPPTPRRAAVNLAFLGGSFQLKWMGRRARTIRPTNSTSMFPTWK